MPDYKTMYRKLFGAVTEAIEILKQAQIETEEMYILSGGKEDDNIKNFRIVEKLDKD